MVPLLDDFSVFEDEDTVEGTHGGEPVGYHETRPPLHQFVQPALNEHFAPGINVAGRLVEQQYGGIRNRGTGNVEQLPLSLAQVLAVVLQHGIVPVRQPLNEGVGRGQLRRTDNVVIRRIEVAEPDIVGYRSRKEMGRSGSCMGYCNCTVDIGSWNFDLYQSTMPMVESGT